jgi:phosphoserine phosphatase RsbU/P
MPWLKMIKGESLGRAFPLDREAMVVGRDNCDLVLDDHLVSKRHARIVRSGDGYLIEDLGSLNGTMVNKQALIGSRLLVDGDEIEVGDTQFVFIDSSTTIKGSLDVSFVAAEQTEQVHPEAKLQALLKIAGSLGGTIDLDGVLEKILEALFTILPQAERGFILLRGEGTDELTLKASRDRQEGSGPPIFSKTIFNHVTKEGRAVLCEDVGADERFDSPSIRESRIRTMICVPLWNHLQQPFGVLQVDTQDEQHRFGEDDLELLVAVAGPVSVAIENARLQVMAVKQAEIEREAMDARKIQLALVPDRHPEVPGYEFWHYYEPAHSVGGDYFDYRPLPSPEHSSGHPGGHWAIAIGDVSGKGMPAALLMARFSSEVSLLLQTEADPAGLVGRLNRNFCAGRTSERFITFLLVLLDSEQNEMTVVTAGHMPPLIRRKDGLVEEISLERKLMLGADADEPYEASRFSIGAGEVVVLYTDGVTDAGRTGREPLNEFGFERLKQALAAAPSEVGLTGKAIKDAAIRHAAGRPQFDDMTLICFGRT